MSAVIRFGGLVLAASLTVGACSSAGASAAPPTAAPATQAPSAAPSASAAAPSSAGPTVGTMTTTLGIVLTGANGLTLYTHMGDGPNSSTCAGGCATAWPPLMAPAGQQPTAGTGVTGTLASFTRADGSSQVSYDGLPLYFWQGDKKPGDVTGQGVNGFAVATVAGSMPATSSPASAPAPSASGYGY